MGINVTPGRRALVDRAEAPVDMVVDHADVLHERVHARGPDEAVPLRLQLPGERLRLRRDRGQVSYGQGCTLAGHLVGLRQRNEVGDANIIARALSTVAWIL